MSDNRYDVFLSHATRDHALVEELARRLIREGIKPWLARWELPPGGFHETAIAAAIADCSAFAAIISPGGLGKWQSAETAMVMDRRGMGREHPIRVIPVILPGAERPNPGEHPSFLTATTWVEFRDTLDDPDAFRRLIAAIRGIEPDANVFEGKTPYRGLEFFDVEHAPLFFGREALTERLLDGLRRTPSGAENRFLAIVGASGSGKSSLARAGLMAALKDGKLDGSAAWPRAICRPGSEPFLNLAKALASVAPETAGNAVFDLFVYERHKLGEETLNLAADMILDKQSRTERLVVLVDQFEELFTLCDNEKERRDFIANLSHAARVKGGRTIVVLTIRADFYARCAAHAEMAAALSDHQVLIGPMADDELRRAIEMPARLAGLEIEPGLVELLLGDLRGRPGALPLLQFALQEVWRRREGDRLTIQTYRDIGHIEGALLRKADAVYAAFTDQQKELCRRVFLRLVQPGEGSEDTRRRASLRDLLTDDPEQAGAVRAIIGRLADPDSRLLTTGGPQDTSGEGTVEIAHEALIRGWPQLRKWIEAERVGLRTYLRLADAAKEWADAAVEIKEDTLYAGARLAVASEWAQSHPGELGALEAAFLTASQEHERHRMADEVERARRLAEAENELAEVRSRNVGKSRSLPRLEYIISHALEDSEFASKLRDRLAAEGVKVRMKERSLVAGAMLERIRRFFAPRHVFILVLSEHSVRSDWVKNGLVVAQQMEEADGRNVLGLVSLDDAWREHVDPYAGPGDPNRALWLALRTKPIVDFSAWRTRRAFEQAFGKFARDLRVPDASKTPPEEA